MWENVSGRNEAMESFSRSWSAPCKGSDLIARKKVDWSIFLYGSHIPLRLRARFEQANGGVRIAQGQKERLTLVIDGQSYRASLVHYRASATSYSLQIRWDNNWRFRSLLQHVFESSHRYLSERKSGKVKTVVDVPDDEAEYIEFRATGSPFVYLLSFHKAVDIGENPDLGETSSGNALESMDKLTDRAAASSFESSGTTAAQHSRVAVEQTATPLPGVCGIMQDASAGSDADVLIKDIERDQALYGVLLECMSTRSANVLRNNGVRDIHSFLELPEEVLSEFRCAGSKTVNEILNFQERIRPVLAQRDGNNGDIPSHMLKRLLISARPKSHPVSRPLPTPVVVRADDPARWSVLRKPLLDAFDIEDEARHNVWESAESHGIEGIGFSPDDKQRLASVAIFDQDTVDVFLSASLWFLLNSGISQQAFDQIVSTVKGFISATECVATDDFAGTAFPSRSAVSDSDVQSVSSLRIDSCGTPPDAVAAAAAIGAHRWGDLPKATEHYVFQQHGLSMHSLQIMKRLWELRLHARAISDRVNRGLALDAYSDFDILMRSLVQRLAKNPQENLVLSGRLGCDDGRIAKLEELAVQLGVTRARVSQIARRRLDALRNSPEIIARFWLGVKSVLDDHGGICTVRDLGRDLSRLLDWQSAPRLRSLVAILGQSDFLTVDEKGGYVCRTDLKCCECEAATGMLRAMLTDVDEMHAVDASARLSMACNQVCFDRNGGVHISPALVTMIASRSEGIVSEGNKILTKDAWERVYGRSLRTAVRLVLEDTGHPLHYSEIAERIRMTNLKYSKVTSSQIHTVLSNGICPEFKIAGRGTYGLSTWEIKPYRTHAEAVMDLLEQSGEPMRAEIIVERLARNGEYKPGNIRAALTSHPRIVKVGQDTFDLADRICKQSVAQEAEDIVIAIGDIDADVWKL